jgi:hypothetical protein
MATTNSAPNESVSLGQALLFAVGATALGVLSGSQPLLGTAIYAVAASSVLAIQYRNTSQFLQLSGIGEAPPGEITLVVVGLASAIVFPALTAASGLGYFTWTPVAAGVGFAVAGLFVLYGLFGFRASRQR